MSAPGSAGIPSLGAFPCELVIFDCDGVLVDSERLSVAVEVELLNEMGWEITAEEIVELFMGRSDAHMVGLIEERLGPVPGFLERYRERLFAAIDTELTAVDGVHDALAELDRLGVPSCVASSGTHEKLRRTLGRTGLLERFEGRIHSAGDVANGKPAPDLFLHAARTHGVPPERCVVVEDSPAGIAAATAAGMPSIAYAAGFVPRSQLEASATSVIDDMAEVPRVLGG